MAPRPGQEGIVRFRIRGGRFLGAILGDRRHLGKASTSKRHVITVVLTPNSLGTAMRVILFAVVGFVAPCAALVTSTPAVAPYAMTAHQRAGTITLLRNIDCCEALIFAHDVRSLHIASRQA